MSAIRSPSRRHGLSITALGLAAAITIVPVPVLASMGVEPAEPSAPIAAPEPAAAAPEPTAAAEPSAPGAPAPVAPAPTAEHDVMIADGNQLLADGKPIEGAEKLSTAYVIMPLQDRVGPKGRYVVSLACNAYEAAWQSTRDGAHLEANRVLLSAYFADLESARASGTATVPADAQEQALRDRRAGIDQVLADLEASSSPAAPTTEPGDPGAIEPQAEVIVPPPDPRLRRNALILVSAGATGVVAGGIMVIAGARAASRAEEARQTMSVSEAGDARSTKVAGTIVATTGALLASGAVMVLGMGSSRLRRQRENLAVMLHPTIGGLALRGRF